MKGENTMKHPLRMLSSLLTLALISTLGVGCSQNPSKSSSASGAALAESNLDSVIYRLSVVQAVNDPVTKAAMEFAENVKEKTEGRVVVEVYPANQLGDTLSVFDEIMRGTIDMAYAPPADNYEPDIYLSFLPFLATSYDDLSRIYGKEGYLFQESEKLYQKLGIKLLGYGTIGFLGVGASKPVVDENKKALKNVLVRTSSDLLSKLTMEGMGFNVSTMPYVDVFSGLQTGIIDGWLGGNPSINYFSFRDVIQYYYHYKIIMENNHFYINQKSFEKMSAEDQAAFEDCAEEMFRKSYEDAQALDEQYLKELSDFGITVVEFTDAEMDEMARNVRENVWPKIGGDKYSAEFIENLKNSLS
ncbi:TRAP transporter substrate-binding protein DctP [Anaerotruncus rubiinfantis]|uniref:TRAP transporter substrate-binding protein DctP n=2 Tax=Anaerotruncus rubiinfantis TaxID=1720200 RepID=UPI0034A57E79